MCEKTLEEDFAITDTSLRPIGTDCIRTVLCDDLFNEVSDLLSATSSRVNGGASLTSSSIYQ